MPPCQVPMALRAWPTEEAVPLCPPASKLVKTLFGKCCARNQLEFAHASSEDGGRELGSPECAHLPGRFRPQYFLTRTGVT
jgi:hypothetical protein